MARTCPHCGISKDIGEFAWRNKRQGKRQSWCKACHRDIDTLRYRNGPSKIQVQVLNARYQERNRKYVSDYKLERGCVVCGYRKCAAALDLHHPDGEKKEACVAAMVSNKVSLKRLVSEISKCQVICACCHRELHHMAP